MNLITLPDFMNKKGKIDNMEDVYSIYPQDLENMLETLEYLHLYDLWFMMPILVQEEFEKLMSSSKKESAKQFLDFISPPKLELSRQSANVLVENSMENVVMNKLPELVVNNIDMMNKTTANPLIVHENIS